MSKLVRAISENGGVTICALDSTDIVREMERIHHPSATVSAALGRLLTGCALMGANLKNLQDTLSVRVNGDGPCGLLFAMVDGKGNVKGYAENPLADMPSTPQGKLNVGGIVGQGTLYVIKDLGMKEPYVGMVPLVSGEIAEDITSYYAVSEQIPTVCALGVLVDRDLTILKAGGYLVQLLPGATEEEIELLERNIAAMPPVTQLLSEGKDAFDLIQLAMEGFSPNILDEGETAYRCDCEAERFERALLTLGREELHNLEQENDDIEVKCHFCGKEYHFSAGTLLDSLQKEKAES